MNEALPQYIFNRITDITIEDLRKIGAKAVAVDLDNTLLYDSSYRFLDGAKKWVEEMKAEKMPIIILSNTYNKRANALSKTLDIDYISKARKPDTKGYFRAAEKLGIDVSELAMIGDQLLKDILGANRAGAISIYVKPFMTEKLLYFYYKVIRAKERRIFEQAKLERGDAV